MVLIRIRWVPTLFAYFDLGKVKNDLFPTILVCIQQLLEIKF